MSRPIEFTYADCEFETADGIMLAGPMLTLELESDGSTFTVESVRNEGFAALGKPAGPAPVYVCDFINQWVKDDLAKGSASLLREAYEDAVRYEEGRAADDWADFKRDERRMLAAE